MKKRQALLLPFWWGLRNRFMATDRMEEVSREPGKAQERPGGRENGGTGRPSLKTIALFLFGLALTIGIYFISWRVIRYFHEQNELGVILSLKILQMAWIILFAMLVFSSMVSAVSTIFLSKDNEIIFAAPIRPAEIFWMRSVTTFIYTSWMMVIFSLPFFIAYGRVFTAGWLYWPLLALVLPATAASASTFGTVTTVALVRFFPARRTKDIVFYLSLCFGIFLFLMFRLIKPEELVNPERFGSFVEYLSSISTPAGPYVPAAWSANLLCAYLLDREVDLLLLALILVTPVALFFLGEWAMARWFFTGYSRAQESFGGYRRFAAARRRRPLWQWLFIKELKTFLRDSTEWSQLFMVAALVVVYLYNFKLLPVDRSPMATEYITNLISFLNIGLIGFMVASLSARFVFPSIGAEGGAFFLIQSSPLTVGRFLAHKYLFYVVPFSLFSLLLVTASDKLLGIEGPMWWFSVGTSLVLTWTVVALAIGFGAIHADFKAESRVAALGGMGAILFLFVALVFEVAVICSAALPVYWVVKKWLHGIDTAPGDLLQLAIWGIGSLLLAICLAGYFFWQGVKALSR